MHACECNLELFCPKDFHNYSGVDACLLLKYWFLYSLKIYSPNPN